MSEIRLIHIVNPADASLCDDPAQLRQAQPLALRSIENAVRHSSVTDDELSITVAAAFFIEDENSVPSFAVKCPPLQRSILDIASFRERRKLPILKDILGTFSAYSEEDFFVYTNSDIIVSPVFYNFVATEIRRGCDCLTVTRRTLPDSLNSETDLNVICSALGAKHPGHDCFIFSARVKERLALGETCVGAKHLVPPFLAQLMSFSKNFVRMDDRHLTFHIGDPRPWNEDRFSDYADFNFREGKKVIGRLHEGGLLPSHYLCANWLQRFGIIGD